MHSRFTWFASVLALLSINSAQAEIKPHALFSDNAVLQQGVKVPVWGTTDKPDAVKVSFAGQEVTATPANNQWRVDLAPLKAGGEPQSMMISQGDAKLEIKNILIGEVWLCGGQSNMQWAVSQSVGAQEAIAGPPNDNIRLLTVRRRGNPTPEAAAQLEQNWIACTPQSLPGFTAVGYFFGREINKTQKVPVGLISSNVGGTTAERWMSKESIESNPDLKEMSKPQGASDLHNAMIAPLAPFAIRGAIWYQGESNADRAYQYRKLLPAMIKNWRDTFGQGEFPFLIVQLAPFMDITPEPTDSAWAELRDAQLYTAKTVPIAAQAVITDVGEEKDIHPPKKEPVGVRLALAARALSYGEKIEYSGPVFDKLIVSGDKAIVQFQHVGGGLVAKDDDLKGFTIAGEDRKFYNANAKIEAGVVVVSSDKVPKPIAVRYGWANYPVVNLWNKDGLPATPFRTDDFPVTTQEKK